MCALRVTWYTSKRYGDACVARTLISFRCVPCHPWCTHQTSLVVKKSFFNFPVAVNNSVKVDPLVFLLYMFVITENITKRPVKLWMINWKVVVVKPCDLLTGIFRLSDGRYWQRQEKSQDICCRRRLELGVLRIKIKSCNSPSKVYDII